MPGPPDAGWIDASLAAEVPGLSLVSREVPAPQNDDSEPGVVYRLEVLAGRLHGGRAVELRREAIPAAYRVTFRHLGLDPEVQRTPIEDAVIGRLVRGGYTSRGRLDDALLLALIETSVEVLAFDADALEGPLGLRPARRGETLGHAPHARPAAGGKLALCDQDGPVGELFGELAGDVAPGRNTRNVRLAVVGVPGVPDASIDEALWICEQALSGPSAE